MTIANCKIQLSSDIASVWSLVTDLTNYQWRSDLSSIEVKEGGSVFIEHTKDGFMTTFTITVWEPLLRYEFDMENKNMKGKWIGIFEDNEKGTLLDFTEDVEVRNPVMRLMAKPYLKKQQTLYMKDLKNALGEGYGM